MKGRVVVRNVVGFVLGSCIFTVGGFFLEKLLFLIMGIGVIHSVLAYFPIVWIIAVISLVLTVWSIAYGVAELVVGVLAKSGTPLIAFYIVAILYMIYCSIASIFIMRSFNIAVLSYIMIMLWGIKSLRLVPEFQPRAGQ